MDTDEYCRTLFSTTGTPNIGHMEWNTALILFFVFFALTIFFNLAAAAITALDDIKLKKTAKNPVYKDNENAAEVLDLLKNPAKFRNSADINRSLCALIAAVCLYDFIISNVSTNVLNTIFIAESGIPPFAFICAVFMTVFVCGYIIIIFGKIIPENLGGFHAEKIAFRLITPFVFLIRIFMPATFLINSSVNLIMRLLSINSKELAGKVTEEDIRMLVDVGNENGTIEESQKEMINNVFEFDDRTVDEVMTHRVDILGVSDKYKISEVVYCAINEGFSRIPVYAENIDNITGIINVKDLLCLVGVDPDGYEISNFIRPALYVPESVKCKDLFKEFSIKKIHFAVVVDQYGGTAGIVTMEDLIESIVGNIQDEYDDEHEKITQINDNTYLIEGSASVDDLTRKTGINLKMPKNDPDMNFETAGGLIVHLLQRIPEEGENPVVSCGNAEFTVVLMKEQHISRIKAVVMPDKV